MTETGLRTSISTKLGVGSSPSAHHPVFRAPVALPGLMKNFPSISYASNRCVPPQRRTSTSICRAAINRLSASPVGTIVCPCVKPILKDPCVTTFDRGRLGASTSKSPLTICRSGATPRRNSYVSLSVMLPRHKICPILPGARSFLNCARVSVTGVQCVLGGRCSPWRGWPDGQISTTVACARGKQQPTAALSGMKRSPRHSTSLEVMIANATALVVYLGHNCTVS